MTINELQELMGHRIESMCLYCSRQHCQFICTGEMYYGQEVGPTDLGIMVYECPKFIHDNTRKDPVDVKPAFDILGAMAKDIEESSNVAKLNDVYRYYSHPIKL